MSRKARRSGKRATRTKAAAQREHAKRRFWERHHLDVSDADLARMVHLIQTGKAEFRERQSNRVSVWDVMFEGRPRRVAYDGHRHEIVTVLLPEGEPCTG